MSTGPAAGWRGRWRRFLTRWQPGPQHFVFKPGGEVPVPRDLLSSLQHSQATVWPKDQPTHSRRRSGGRLLAVYDDVVVLTPPGERHIGLRAAQAESCFLFGVFGAVFPGFMLFGLPKVDMPWVFHAIMIPTLAFLTVMTAAALLFGAVELGRLLLGPKRLPLVFNRATGEVHRFVVEVPPFPIDLKRLFSAGMYGDIARYARPLTHPHEVTVETFDWDVLDGKDLGAGTLCLHATDLRGGKRRELVVPLTEPLTDHEEALALWEYLRGFMEDGAPARVPDDPPAPDWSNSLRAACKTFMPWWAWFGFVPLVVAGAAWLHHGQIGIHPDTGAAAALSITLAPFLAPAMLGLVLCVLVYRFDPRPMLPPALESRWGPRHPL